MQNRKTRMVPSPTRGEVLAMNRIADIIGLALILLISAFPNTFQ
jgi:hypothetical protein